MMTEQFASTVPLQDVLDDLRSEAASRRRRSWAKMRDNEMTADQANAWVARAEAACYAIEHLMRQQGEEPLPEPRERRSVRR